MNLCIVMSFYETRTSLDLSSEPPFSRFSVHPTFAGRYTRWKGASTTTTEQPGRLDASPVELQIETTLSRPLLYVATASPLRRRVSHLIVTILCSPLRHSSFSIFAVDRHGSLTTAFPPWLTTLPKSIHRFEAARSSRLSCTPSHAMLLIL